MLVSFNDQLLTEIPLHEHSEEFNTHIYSKHKFELDWVYEIKNLLHLLGSKASDPPLEPPPGVLHTRRSIYSSATKGSWFTK